MRLQFGWGGITADARHRRACAGAEDERNADGNRPLHSRSWAGRTSGMQVAIHGATLLDRRFLLRLLLLFLLLQQGFLSQLRATLFDAFADRVHLRLLSHRRGRRRWSGHRRGCRPGGPGGRGGRRNRHLVGVGHDRWGRWLDRLPRGTLTRRGPRHCRGRFAADAAEQTQIQPTFAFGADEHRAAGIKRLQLPVRQRFVAFAELDPQRRACDCRASG